LNICLEIILCEEKENTILLLMETHCRRSLLYDVYRFIGNDMIPIYGERCRAPLDPSVGGGE